MGFLDSLSGIVDTVSKVSNAVTPIAQLGLTGYSLYNGMQNANAASDYYDTLAGTAEMQDQIAKDQWGIQKPLMEKQALASGSDLDIYNANAGNRSAIAGQEYANTRASNNLSGISLGKAGQYLPGLLDQQYELAGRQLASQNADQNLYDSSRGIVAKFFDESLNGVNPATEMNQASNAVEQSFAGANNSLNRELARKGVSLGSGQALAASQQQAIQKALAKAGARTNAWNEAKATNYSRLGNAVNVRNGLDGAISTPNVSSVNSANMSAPNSGVSLGGAASTAGAAGSTSAALAQAASKAAADSFTTAGYGLGIINR